MLFWINSSLIGYPANDAVAILANDDFKMMRVNKKSTLQEEFSFS